MAGGLLQIASRNISDIFLTFEPQITFFKLIYFRYYNFSIETIEEYFDGLCNFGETISCNLSKVGDLLHKIYLKIDLPEVDIKYLNDQNNILVNDLNVNINILNNKINNFKKFNIYAFDLWRNLWNEVISPVGSYESIFYIINNFITIEYNSYISEFNNINNNISKSTNYNFNIIEFFNNNLKDAYKLSIYNIKRNDEFKATVIDYLNNYKFEANTYLQYLINQLQELINRKNIITSTNYYFAWVKKIGINLIDYIDIEIGGQIVDRLNADSINLYYETNTNYNHENIIFNKMIGDVPELTTYNNNKKPSYSIYIFIPFWFSKYAGSSIPVIALRYQDVKINLKIKDIHKCIYFKSDDINISEYIKLNNISIYADYIFVDSAERDKFGQSNLEYLIEQNQFIFINDIKNLSFYQNIPFSNPIKELFWTIQSKNNLNNFNEWNNYDNILNYTIINITSINIKNIPSISLQIKENHLIQKNDIIQIKNSRFYNGTYTVYDVNQFNIIINIPFQYNDQCYVFLNNDIDIIDNILIKINGIDRLSKRDSFYFNTIQPYQHHTRLPSKGIHNFSFALHPELYQPSGTCNTSVAKLSISFDFNKNIINQINLNNDSLILKLFATSINILKINKGMASLDWSF